MSNQKQNWNGGSGKIYEFTIYDINTAFDPNNDGNYIFTKIVSDTLRAIYIGEGDLKIRTESHIREGCVTKKGATHIHILLENNDDIRKNIQSDLLAEHTEAYIPTGCNIKTGG